MLYGNAHDKIMFLLGVSFGFWVFFLGGGYQIADFPGSIASIILLICVALFISLVGAIWFREAPEEEE